jgi:hypothetical protein
MDPQDKVLDNQDRMLQELAVVERNLKSLRYTFGIVLIILIVLLAIAAPTFVAITWNSLFGSTTEEESAVTAKESQPVAQEHAPASLATTTATTTAP